MTTTRLLLCALVGLLSSDLFAQRAIGWLGVETDPMTTVFGARTLSILVEPQKTPHWSLFLNVVYADFPTWLDDLTNPKNEGKGFDTRILLGGGAALDYFLKEERVGTYFGMIHLFFENEVIKDNERQEVLTHNIIPRIGYRWYPFRRVNFYLNPFLGLRLEHDFGKGMQVSGKAYEAAGLQPFGTMHVGYHF